MISVRNCNCNGLIHGDQWTSLEAINHLHLASSFSMCLKGRQCGRMVPNFSAKKRAIRFRVVSLKQLHRSVPHSGQYLHRDGTEIPKCRSRSAAVEPVLRGPNNEFCSKLDNIFAKLDENRDYSEWLSLSSVRSNLADGDIDASDFIDGDEIVDVPEKMPDEVASRRRFPKDSISIEILINTSECSMQRIAVLEDGELVELLLEPVKKDNVLCDSIYLGVVKELAPRMGGAFLNIGIRKIRCFMEIQHGKQPFIFPPFKKEVTDTAPSSTIREQLGAIQNGRRQSDDVKEPNDEQSGSISSAKYSWDDIRLGTKIVVQVVKERLGRKCPYVTPYPKLKGRFWILVTRGSIIEISKNITGDERTRLKEIAKALRPPGFGLIARTRAKGHCPEELKKDLEGLLSTWKTIMEHAKSAALAADEGVEKAVPVILHRAKGQTLSVVQDYFCHEVKRMVVDSRTIYHEVTSYLQKIAPDLCDRVELHSKKIPLFHDFKIEDEMNNLLQSSVPLPDGGYLVIEQSEALVSIDVNGGHKILGVGSSQEKANLDVNLAAAKQIARELRLRDIGGIIVVDFMKMECDVNRRLVYEEVLKAVERDRSPVHVCELSKDGLMEITRMRVRSSLTDKISEPCSCCQATGRVEALETSFAKIEREICRLLAEMDQREDPENPMSRPKMSLTVDGSMYQYLNSRKKRRLTTLSDSLKVWIVSEVERNFTRGAFKLKPLTDDEAENDKNSFKTWKERPAEPPSCISITIASIAQFLPGKLFRKDSRFISSAKL